MPAQDETSKIQHYHVRPLAHDELPAYHALRLRGLELHPEAFGESAEHFRAVSVDDLSRRLRESEQRGGFILVAYDSKRQLVGTIALAISDGEKMCHRGIIWGMFVAPEARGAGVARTLVRECVSRATTIPTLELLHLAVVTTNTAAFELYTSAGFAVYGTEPNALKVGSNRFDEYLMVKFLRDSK